MSADNAGFGSPVTMCVTETHVLDHGIESKVGTDVYKGTQLIRAILVLWATITKYHRLSGLKIIEIYFSRVWRLESKIWRVPAQLSFGENLFPGCRLSSFGCISHGREERGETTSSMTPIKVLIPF